MPANVDENEQMHKVLQFKSKMNNNSFIWEYNNSNHFRDVLRKHLCLFMAHLIQEKNKPSIHKALPKDEDIQLLKDMWKKMSPELQRMFTTAYNENRMKGDAGIQTRDFFAAMVTEPGPEVQAIVNHIPTEALPKPIEGEIVADPYIIKELPWLSHCISSSLKRMKKALPDGRQLTAADVITDIMKNGTGESVALLRKHNVTANTISDIIKTENLEVLQAL